MTTKWKVRTVSVTNFVSNKKTETKGETKNKKEKKREESVNFHSDKIWLPTPQINFIIYGTLNFNGGNDTFTKYKRKGGLNLPR